MKTVPEYEMTEEQLNEELQQEQLEINAAEWQQRMEELRYQNYDFEYGDVIQ